MCILEGLLGKVFKRRGTELRCLQEGVTPQLWGDGVTRVTLLISQVGKLRPGEGKQPDQDEGVMEQGFEPRSLWY